MLRDQALSPPRIALAGPDYLANLGTGKVDDHGPSRPEHVNMRWQVATGINDDAQPSLSDNGGHPNILGMAPGVASDVGAADYSLLVNEPLPVGRFAWKSSREPDDQKGLKRTWSAL